MRLFLSTLTAIAIAAGAPALAVTADDTARLKVQRYAHGWDVSTLSSAQIAALINTIHSGEHESEKKQTVASLIRKWK